MQPGRKDPECVADKARRVSGGVQVIRILAAHRPRDQSGRLEERARYPIEFEEVRPVHSRGDEDVVIQIDELIRQTGDVMNEALDDVR